MREVLRNNYIEWMTYLANIIDLMLIINCGFQLRDPFVRSRRTKQYYIIFVALNSLRDTAMIRRSVVRRIQWDRIRIRYSLQNLESKHGRRLVGKAKTIYFHNPTLFSAAMEKRFMLSISNLFRKSSFSPTDAKYSGARLIVGALGIEPIVESCHAPQH